MESFKIPEFPSSLDRIQTEFENANFNIDNGSLKGNAQNAHSVEYEIKTRIEYREKLRIKYRTEQREKFGMLSKVWRFFGVGGYEDVEFPYEETFKEPYEVSYQVSHDVYNVENFKDSIACELNDRMARIINSYLKLFADFEKDIKLASSETEDHKKALERDIEIMRQIKDNLQPFFKMWNDILSGETKG